MSVSTEDMCNEPVGTDALQQGEPAEAEAARQDEPLEGPTEPLEGRDVAPTEVRLAPAGQAPAGQAEAERPRGFLARHGRTLVVLAIAAGIVAFIIALTQARAADKPSVNQASADVANLSVAPAYDPGEFGRADTLSLDSVDYVEVVRDTRTCTATGELTYAGEAVSAEQSVSVGYVRANNGGWTVSGGATTTKLSWTPLAGADPDRVLAQADVLLQKADIQARNASGTSSTSTSVEESAEDTAEPNGSADGTDDEAADGTAPVDAGALTNDEASVGVGGTTEDSSATGTSTDATDEEGTTSPAGRSLGGGARASLYSLYRDASCSLASEEFDQEALTDTLVLHFDDEGAFVSHSCDLTVVLRFRTGTGQWELASCTADAHALDEDYSALVGSWKGTFSTQDNDGHGCYAARTTPLALRIEQVDADADGVVTLSGSLDALVHHHGSLSADANETPGDQLVQGETFTGTLEQGDYGYVATCTTPESADGTLLLELDFGTETSARSAHATLTTAYEHEESILFIPYQVQGTFSDNYVLARSAE